METKKQPTKIEPGSPKHFALLGAPYNFNFLTGKDWQDMQAFARDVWVAALASAQAQQEPKTCHDLTPEQHEELTKQFDAADALEEMGWVFDGDEWLRPPVQQADLADAEQEVSVPISGWTTIPVGTLIFHDFKNSRWPECNNAEPGDLETLFEVSVRGDTVTLKADGFGGDPYGSGVILVNLSHWKQAWAAIAATKKDKP